MFVSEAWCDLYANKNNSPLQEEKILHGSSGIALKNPETFGDKKAYFRNLDNVDKNQIQRSSVKKPRYFAEDKKACFE